MSSPPVSGPGCLGRRAVLLAGGLVLLLGLAGCSDDSDTSFEGLTSGQRVYDTTGRSLSDDEALAIAERLDVLRASTRADVVVYVRDLDADPDETLDQVEDLQQQWVVATGGDEDTAGAILINREPGTGDEARAGIFVGSTFDDGNVPGSEQERIVEDVLVPPLRDGDVAGSLEAGVEQLATSIRQGPPRTALDDVADGAGSTWLPWLGLALALGALAAVLRISARRPRATIAAMPPTTVRPDRETSAALAAALVGSGTPGSTIPAVLVDLAARDALAIEQEKAPGFASDGTVQVRLLDETAVRGDVERVVWAQLSEHADDGLVDSDGLGAVAQDTGAVDEVVRRQLDERGWRAAGAGRAILWLVILGLLALVVMVLALVVTVAGAPVMLVAVVPAAVVAVTAFWFAAVHGQLSSTGRDAARPWKAYRDGLKDAGRDEDAAVDLDAVLPDVVALNLATHFTDRLDAATDGTGQPLRAFTAPAGLGAVDPAVFPWAAYMGVFGTSSGGTVSGGGAGGGGGAAGST